MSRLILVCGPTGAGKTTYSIAISEEVKAIRFSIDRWMQTLFASDMTSLDFDWMMERVQRCYEQIWNVRGWDGVTSCRAGGASVCGLLIGLNQVTCITPAALRHRE